MHEQKSMLVCILQNPAGSRIVYPCSFTNCIWVWYGMGRVWCCKITIIWPLTSPLNTHRLTAAAVHSKAWCPATLQKLAKKGWRNKTKSLRHYNSASQEIPSKESIHSCTGTPINPRRLKPLKQVPKTSLPKFLCQPPDNTARNSVSMP